MAVTPKGKAMSKPPSSGKMKQMSLMSFFAPRSSPVSRESEKENLHSTESTPLTSEMDQSNGKHIQSSPLKEKNANTTKEKVKSKITIETSIPSSPVSEQNKRNSPTKLDTKGSGVPATKKRRIQIQESDDEDLESSSSSGDDSDEEEFVPSEAEDEMSDLDVQEEEVDLSLQEEEESDDEEAFVSKKKKQPLKKKEPKASSKTSSLESPKDHSSSSLESKFNSNSSYIATGMKSSPKTLAKIISGKKNFAKENEERYQWLVDIKDAQKRSIDDPEYDPRTLYIPPSAWNKFTNFEKQYWEIKSKMWNTVVFFKKGKFYELYENDAMIANSKFDLKIAGGGRANMKLAGIPEMSFDYWAKEFITSGYKVAKVDQKESMLAKEMRGGSSKEEKIIKRELSGILTGGTLTDMNMLTDEMATYCMSIKEEPSTNGRKFGIAFVDTSTSELNLIELDDEPECTKLATVITQIKPKEIIVEKNNLCSTATKILKFSSNSDLIWNEFNSESEFWDYDTTLENLVRAKYYEAEDLDDMSKYPEVLVNYKDNKKTAFTAFGGLLYYLTELKLDTSIMTMGNIKEYDIVSKASTMILDGITLANLEILNNSSDGSDKGTLFKLINRAITPFGKRHLKSWVLHPLLKTDEINSRYDAVEFLMNNGEFRDILEKGLAKIPDLERLIARVHSKTLRFKDFVKVIEGFEQISSLQNVLKSFSLEKAGVLRSFLDSFPQDLDKHIESWSDAFDREKAIDDIVVPERGVDPEFDESQVQMDEVESKLNMLLKQYRKEYKSQEISFKDSGKEIYLIEVPIKIKAIPKDWQQMGATSKVKRFWSPEAKKLARSLMELRETHKMLCETLRGRIYERFDVHYNIWSAAIKSLAKIDCIIALTKASESIGHPSCRPQFIESDQGFVDFKELRHPCFYGSTDFIPNDVKLGREEANFGLLTGANAAGKSTLMRTTALAVILSQIGCYVPAESAQLSTIDRIMTRLGANDNIMQGKSTFFVELSETKKILDNATPKSLVILDELGRGGSSSDGYAIAESVLYHLATHVQPIGFFATHYGTLGLSFKTHPNVKPLRMAIVVDKESRNITFLYKLEAGYASGSFGMNVASMCGIADKIVEKAEIAAKEYEHTSKLKKLTDSMLNNKNDVNISLGIQSDFKWLVNNHEELSKSISVYNENVEKNGINYLFNMIDSL